MGGTPKTARIGPPRSLKKKCLETWKFFLSVFIKIKSRPALLNHATPLACTLGSMGVCHARPQGPGWAQAGSVFDLLPWFCGGTVGKHIRASSHHCFNEIILMLNLTLQSREGPRLSTPARARSYGKVTKDSYYGDPPHKRRNCFSALQHILDDVVRMSKFQ